jgi:hypothetical protein
MLPSTPPPPSVSVSVNRSRGIVALPYGVHRIASLLPSTGSVMRNAPVPVSTRMEGTGSFTVTQLPPFISDEGVLSESSERVSTQAVDPSPSWVTS